MIYLKMINLFYVIILLGDLLVGNDFNKKREKLCLMFNKYIDRITLNGLENIPNKGTNIFVVNHNCFLDIYLIAYILNMPCISMVSANSLFGSNEERKEKLNELLYPYPIEMRASTNYKDAIMNGAVKLLLNGKNVIVFPQGVFDKEKKVSRARTGIIRILFDALSVNDEIYNIIPIALEVSNVTLDNIQSSNVWDCFKANITILPRFNYSEYYYNYLKCKFRADKNIILHNLMDLIMKDIAKCLNYQYVNEYIKLYDMDGFWFPDGKYVKFEDSNNELLYMKYSEMINSITNKYCGK